jgi:hypothetical protein
VSRLHARILCVLSLGLLALPLAADPLPSFDYVGTYKAIKVTSSGDGAYTNTITVPNAGSGSSNLVAGGFHAELSTTGTTPYTAATTVGVWTRSCRFQAATSTRRTSRR